ncbi:MAG: toll/interleukin-1 receptor domain-containing protein [Candidatus Binatia bacterium]
MTRNRVFISYSHNDKDQAFLTEFRVHLKPWEDAEKLNVWSDQRLTPSQDWHQEIREALATTAVAVLLVSPNFLASKYIREVELPALLYAREEGQLDLACLYLRPSAVNDEDMTFEVTRSSGEKLHVNPPPPQRRWHQYNGLKVLFRPQIGSKSPPAGAAV